MNFNPSRCWLCLKCTTDENHYESTSFQMLMRYLDLNLVTLWGSSVQNYLEIQGIISVCEECSVKLKDFMYLYQHFEVTRLAMDKSINDLHNLIQSSEPIFKEDCQGSNIGSEVIKLRRETLKKGYLRTRTTPRVQLTATRKQRRCDKHASASEFDKVGKTQKRKPPESPKPEVQDKQLSSQYISEDEAPLDGSKNQFINERHELAIPNDNEDFQKGFKKCDDHNTIIPSAVQGSSPVFLDWQKKYWESVFIKSSPSNSNTCTCKYCPYTASISSRISFHALQSHTLEFYSDLLPSGTTRPELHAAISATVEKHLKHPINHNRPPKLNKCTSCVKIYSNTSTVKVHILRKHFNEVVTTLKENRQSCSPSPDATNETQADLVDVKLEPIVVSCDPEQDRVDLYCPSEDPLFDILADGIGTSASTLTEHPTGSTKTS